MASTAAASNPNQAAVASSSQVVSEYVVRVPKSNKKKFNVMRFTTSTGIDVTKFGQTSIKMERENNMKSQGQDEEAPKFGAGSEFGREQREEARKKRYGGNKNYKSEDQPWVLKMGGKNGRKYKGVRGGGITENASYYVFMKAPDGTFEAFPVEEWYNFAPIQRYKALTSEEAEEEFGRREKVMNYFSIMLKKRLTLDEKGSEPTEGEEKTTEKKGKKKGSKSDLKLTDMDEWLSDSDNESNEDEDKSEEDEKKKKTQKGKKGKGKKGGKKKKKDSDEEALEESDEGDFDDREVDYMSDSSTSSEEAPEEKMNKQMKGVEDEEALLKLNVSDEEEEQKEGQTEGEKKEGEKSEEAAANTEEKKVDPKAAKAKVEKKSSSGDSSAETSDSDFDDSKFQSAMFMQKAKKRGTDSAGSSRANTPTRPNGSKSSKRKQVAQPPSMGAPSNKKVKTEAGSALASPACSSEGISEDAVRRYLMRKPMTTTELLQKFKSKRIGISGDQLVTTIAQILKKLNPEKQTIKGKLYLSIKA